MTAPVELDGRAFAHYVDYLGKFAVEPGEFVVGVGASSRDIRFEQEVRFFSGEETREPLTYENELQE